MLPPLEFPAIIIILTWLAIICTVGQMGSDRQYITDRHRTVGQMSSRTIDIFFVRQFAIGRSKWLSDIVYSDNCHRALKTRVKLG